MSWENAWPMTTLAELGGSITSGSRGWASRYSNFGSLFVRITNLRRESIEPDLSDCRFVRISLDEPEAQRTRLRPGDTLISITADIGIVGYINEDFPEPAYINQHIARVRLDPRVASGKFIAYYLTGWETQRRFIGLTDQGAKGGINLRTIADLNVALPDRSEQESIACTLSDTDTLIASLRDLISKKRAIKQGVMQELLTGRTRLSGFTGNWERTSLGEIGRIKTGTRNNQDKKSGGDYPFFVRSATVERIDSYSYDTEAILIPGEGGIGTIFHYIEGKFEVHQRVYKISDFPDHISGKLVYSIMRQFFGPHATENSVKATVDSLRLPTFKSFEFELPVDRHEQDAIVQVLDDADDEIEALERRLRATRAIKQGMMQELLTGRTRLPVDKEVAA